jgi:DNA-binding protein Fis
MDLIPGMRKKLRRRRTEKILEAQADAESVPAEEGVFWHELSIEGFIGKKLDHFFAKLGMHEADGLYDAVIRQVERPLIQKALSWAGGNQIKAARVLGVNRNTLRTKIRKFNIKSK